MRGDPKGTSMGHIASSEKCNEHENQAAERLKMWTWRRNKINEKIL
jgi:hypothetical protein